MASLHIQLQLQRPRFQLDVDLDLPAEGITVLFGASGSGKTTLLRAVAGLERAHGRVALGETLWQDSTQQFFRPTWQRALGYVFQEASLFPHLSVQENLRFGVERTRRAGAEPALAAAIELLGIGSLLSRTTDALSGGERQRVAIARALATQPELLLLDEPLASLDWARRQEILPWLERVHRALRMPVLYVTHAADELTRLADHVVLLGDGQCQAQGHLTELLRTPALAHALGDEAGVVVAATVAERDATYHLARYTFDGGEVWGRDAGLALGSPLRLRLLARDVSLSTQAEEASSIQNRLAGVIIAVEDDTHPSQVRVHVRCGQSVVLARLTRRAHDQLGLHLGQQVWCQVKSVALMV